MKFFCFLDFNKPLNCNSSKPSIDLWDRTNFIVDTEFYCFNKRKVFVELSILDLSKMRVFIYYGYDDERDSEMTYSERRTYKFQRRFHAIPYHCKPFPGLYSQKDLKRFLWRFTFEEEEEARVFGYKGGNAERELLGEFGAYCYNIEHYGVKRFPYLLQEFSEENVLCTHHIDPNSQVHCSRSETILFAASIERNFYREEKVKKLLQLYNSFK